MWLVALLFMILGAALLTVVLWICGVFGDRDKDVAPPPMDKTVQVEVMKTINGISALVDESFENILRNAPDSTFTNDKRSSLQGIAEELVGKGDFFRGEVMKPVDWETFFELKKNYLEATSSFFITTIEEYRSYTRIDFKEYEAFHKKLRAVTWEK